MSACISDDDRTSSHESYAWNYTPSAVNQALLRQANFDSLGRVSIATRAAGQVLDRWVTGYQYDARGRITFVGDTLYHYAAGTCTGPPIVDPDNGIKPCVGTGMTKTLQYVDTVGYDVVGNIVKNTGHGGTGTPTYDAANRLTAWPGLSGVTSDADGNLTSRTVSAGATTNYFWSPDGLLDSVKTSTGGFVRYDYNAFGLLARKWITSAAPDRHFVWDQGHLAIELNGALTQRVGEYAYLPGTDQPLALITGATTVSLVRVVYQDVQGSVIGLVNSNGTVNRYQTNSDPWGISGPWNVALPDTMRLRWQGLFFDGGIANLYYARARWYSPNIKRFLSPDPLGVAAGVNYYTFAGNDPMNGSDPSGMDGGCITYLTQYGTVVNGELQDPPVYKTVCWDSWSRRYSPIGETGGGSYPTVGPRHEIATEIPALPSCPAAKANLVYSLATDVTTVVLPAYAGARVAARVTVGTALKVAGSLYFEKALGSSGATPGAIVASTARGAAFSGAGYALQSASAPSDAPTSPLAIAAGLATNYLSNLIPGAGTKDALRFFKRACQ